MTWSIRTRCVAWAALAALLSMAVWILPLGGGSVRDAGASIAGTVAGEGGDAMTPVMIKLFGDDTAGLSPDNASYTNVDLDQAIADFVGSAPNDFNNDFVVSERPLTSAEAATAKTNGRTFAYVPIVASPVALMTMVPGPSYKGSSTILPSQFCQHVPLSLDQLDGIYGAVTPQFSNWSDSRLSCSSNPTTAADSVPFNLWGNLDPTMENFAIMSLLDSTAKSQAAFAAGLSNAAAGGRASTTDPTPSEKWPYSATAVAGGDEATLGKIVDLDARTAQPSSTAALISLGAILPIDNVWTGNPLGVPWDFPTAAVQNAQGAFVPPSAAAATAAENDATLASTSDPTTNNLVTFTANAANDAAYNNYLMMESYLVVPLNGLPADKAQALAQFIRFAVGGKGQADIAALGAAPATTKMVTADLAVAQQLDQEAASAQSSSSTTTTSTTTASTTTTAVAASATGATTATPASDTTNASTSGGLAATGTNPLPLVLLGAALLGSGEVARQVLRRRKSRV